MLKLPDAMKLFAGAEVTYWHNLHAIFSYYNTAEPERAYGTFMGEQKPLVINQDVSANLVLYLEASFALSWRGTTR